MQRLPRYVVLAVLLTACHEPTEPTEPTSREIDAQIEEPACNFLPPGTPECPHGHAPWPK